MLNVLDISEVYENQWVVLDKLQNVVDHGPDLMELWRKHEDDAAKVTFYFAAPGLP